MNTMIRISALALAVVLSGCSTTKETVKKEEPKKETQTVQKKERTSQDSFAEGVAAFDQGNYEAARASFEAFAAKEPQLVTGPFNLGVVAERQGRVADAQKYYEQALKLAPNHHASLLNLGKAYRLQDKFDQAIALYEGALKEPGAEYDVEILNNLTVAYRLAKKFDKAEATARRVLSRTKDNPDAYKNLALVYFDQGNYRLAEFISANAKKLDAKDPGVYNNLGMIYLKMDDRRLALGQFQKSVQLQDKFAPGHQNIGAMALSYRDYENAEKSFARALAIDPTRYESYLAYAWALDGQKGRDPKKGPQAGEAFEKVLAIKADQPEAICGAGWAYAAEKGGFDKAIGFLEKCKTLAGTSTTDQQLIDSKLKTIASLKAAPQSAPAKEKEKPKASSAGGASLLDKVTSDAEKTEAANPTPAPEGEKKPDEKPAEGQPAPAPTK